jgi:hypothetical protein
MYRFSGWEFCTGMKSEWVWITRNKGRVSVSTCNWSFLPSLCYGGFRTGRAEFCIVTCCPRDPRWDSAHARKSTSSVSGERCGSPTVCRVTWFSQTAINLPLGRTRGSLLRLSKRRWWKSAGDPLDSAALHHAGLALQNVRGPRLPVPIPDAVIPPLHVGPGRLFRVG